MPNWTDNVVTITGIGAADFLKRFMDADGQLDFARIVPTPDNYFDGNLACGNSLMGQALQAMPVAVAEDIKAGRLAGMAAVAEMRKAVHHLSLTDDEIAWLGLVGWYQWNLDHWGCKWNASDFQVNLSRDDSIEVSFNTPWSVPEPVIKALAAKAREAGLSLRCESHYEDGGGWWYESDPVHGEDENDIDASEEEPDDDEEVEM